ncbi:MULTISPECIES: DUF2171 domain-containing protein [Novosphingobium]|jgi:hypothetical protein|uniref:DUF2171 domain-containing protein n=1 Tax=Novosphingobium TaxID=165696 RepID=UPI0022F25F14|nr:MULTISPECIES: DUF2171 domain-containing protein [Novosphingobium]GLK46168.1 hypothetical protein GCM10017612_40900 [Novosphingobium resinovorum]
MTTPDIAWTTQQGTIRKGMKVIAADGSFVGTVAALEGEELMLEGGSHEFVAITQVDGVSADAVLLSDRGDATFGLGATP